MPTRVDSLFTFSAASAPQTHLMVYSTASRRLRQDYLDPIRTYLWAARFPSPSHFGGDVTAVLHYWSTLNRQANDLEVLLIERRGQRRN